LGPPDALVTIVIFGDYTSPSTRSSDRVLRDLVGSRHDVRYVWRHARSGSGAADTRRDAALALAEAARRAGAFWEMHRRLMEMDLRDDEALRAAAGEVHVAASAMTGESSERVHADYRQARDLGVTVEPAVYINGRLLVRAISVERLVELVEEAAAEGERARRAGVPAQDVYTRLVADGLYPRAASPAEGLVVQGLAVGPDEPSREVDPGSGPWLGGSRRAPVQIVWFGDLRCPFTAKQAASLAELAAARPKDVRVTWRHLPLDLHPDADLAHRAAVAAGNQGRFWPFARRILGHAGELDRVAATRIAAATGLDLARFAADLDSAEVAERIEADRAYGRELAPDLVPSTLFVDGRRVTVAASLAVLDELVDDALRDGRPAIVQARRGAKR
jgi:protein-disulfide isomerase